MTLMACLIFFQDTLLSSMFKSPIRGTRMEALPPLDDESQQLCSAALSCLAHYFSWIPLSATITPTLLSTIFHYAGFGCEVRNNRASSPNMSFSNSTQCLGVLAMNCVNELLSKNCVPQEFEDFLLQMFQQTFYLLQKMTKESSTNPTGNRLAELEDRWVTFSFCTPCRGIFCCNLIKVPWWGMWKDLMIVGSNPSFSLILGLSAPYLWSWVLRTASGGSFLPYIKLTKFDLLFFLRLSSC